MPAYTSISFSVPRPIQSGLIERFYKAFMGNEIDFKCVNPWRIKPEKTLEEIIVWNQKQAEKTITPAERGGLPTDEWQVYLEVFGFSECRLIQSAHTNEIYFRCIIPEGEVSVASIAIIERAALRVWDAILVRLVETSGELETDLGYDLISKGIQPSVMPFAILDKKCAHLASSIYFERQTLSRGVILRARIEDKTKVLFDETGAAVAKAELIRIYNVVRPQLVSPQKAKDKVFTQKYMSEHGHTDAVEALVWLVNEGAVELKETDINQLAFIAMDFGLNFRSPHLKGTWIDS